MTTISFDWDEAWHLKIGRDESGLVISGDADGLRGLAQVLLALAEEDVPAGAHVHLDSFKGLPKDSQELLLERV